MRDIKFRAWFEVHKKMIESTNLLFEYNGPDDGFITACDNESTDATFNAILMQYTGLKDKSSREIYEGDVVQRILMALPSRLINEDFIGQVKFCEGAWWIDNGCDAIPLWSEADELVILGNIYEHPHLLETK